MTQGKIHPPPNPSLLTLLGKVATVTWSRIRFVKLLKRGCEVSGLHRHGFSQIELRTKRTNRSINLMST